MLKNINKKKKIITNKFIFWKKKIIKKKYYLSIFISNKKHISILNKKYRKKNKPTDILSFLSDIKNNLGDIIVCQPLIKKIDIETTLIHGILHLLNYDHEKKKDKNIMLKLERKIGMSGIEPPTITTSK